MTLAPARAVPTIVRRAAIPEHLRDWTPRTGLGRSIARALPHLPEDLHLELLERIAQAGVIETSLRLKVLRGLGLARRGLIPWAEIVEEDHGLVSCRVVTDAGVAFLVDAFQNTVESETMKFHGIGTGTNAEAVGNTALQTELTSQYNPDSTRATGSTTESAANTYQTVGTNTLDSGTPAITEHGVFTQAAAGGTLLDRSVFAAINLNGVNGDGLQSDYRFTITSGG